LGFNWAIDAFFLYDIHLRLYRFQAVVDGKDPVVIDKSLFKGLDHKDDTAGFKVPSFNQLIPLVCFDGLRLFDIPPRVSIINTIVVQVFLVQWPVYDPFVLLLHVVCICYETIKKHICSSSLTCGSLCMPSYQL
jgi:hypothetical protein